MMDSRAQNTLAFFSIDGTDAIQPVSLNCNLFSLLLHVLLVAYRHTFTAHRVSLVSHLCTIILIWSLCTVLNIGTQWLGDAYQR